MLPYSKDKSEYTIQDCIVYKGVRVVVPRSMRAELMRVLHSEHCGVVKTIRLARQFVWWPNIDADVNAYVQRCVTCQFNARKQTNPNLIAWNETASPFERVHVDVAFYKSFKFLVVFGSC